MAYTLKFSDPGKTNTIVVEGPILDNYSTSLNLVGQGYSGYGQIMAQNFLKLLENFAGPNAPEYPIQGQLWYDTSNPARGVLRISNGKISSARWPSANGIYQQANDPSIEYGVNLIEGDIWVDTGNTQVFIRYSNTWKLVGPTVSTGIAKTGVESVTLQSNFGESFPVLLNWVNGKVIAITSYNAFTPRTVIDGFSNLSVGINLNYKVSGKFNGLADRASSLEISNGVLIKASEILKNTWPSAQRQIMSGALIVESTQGLFVRRPGTAGFTAKELQLYTTANSGAVINFDNAASSLKIGINNISYINFNGSNGYGNIGINTSTVENVTLSVGGSATFKNNIRITTSSVSTVGLTLDGSASIGGNATVLGNLTVSGLTTISNRLTVGGNIIPNTTIQAIGSEAMPFERIFVKNIGSATTYVRIFGSVTTATTLETVRYFNINGHSTSTLAVGFNGSNSVTMTTTLDRSAITSPLGGSTSTTNENQTLLVLDTSTNTTDLQSISKKNFLSDIYSSIMNTGMIIPSGTSTVSSSFLLCDGAPYQQVGTYTNLFNVIGTRYGVGLAGTFRVPYLLNVTTSTTASVTSSIFYHIKI